MMNIKKTVSKRKGQINLAITNQVYEKLHLFFHANTLVPIRDTLHFGLKPGHFFLYTKKYNEDGRWLVKDAGYINYFRADQTNIIQTEYNTLGKQKLLSRGILTYKILDSKVILNSYSLFPVHHRQLVLDVEKETVEIVDRFLWKTSIFFNTDKNLITDNNKWYNRRVIRLDE